MTEVIHPLRRWLFENRETITVFAGRINISQGHLSDILNGKRRPALDLMDRITEATAGAIVANDFQRPRQSCAASLTIESGG